MYKTQIYTSNIEISKQSKRRHVSCSWNNGIFLFCEDSASVGSLKRSNIEEIKMDKVRQRLGKERNPTALLSIERGSFSGIASVNK